MDDKLNFDTLDILTAAIGIAFAFMLLPQPVSHLTGPIVVPSTIETLLGHGIVLLLIATVIDRRWLKKHE